MHVHVYTRRGKTCGSYVHLCAPLAAIEIMQSGGARERERGERMGSALETGEKKKEKEREKKEEEKPWEKWRKSSTQS